MISNNEFKKHKKDRPNFSSSESSSDAENKDKKTKKNIDTNLNNVNNTDNNINNNYYAPNAGTNYNDNTNNYSNNYSNNITYNYYAPVVAPSNPGIDNQPNANQPQNNNSNPNKDPLVNEHEREIKVQKNETFKKYANYAYGICLAGAVISFIIAVLGILINLKTVTTISKYLIAFGFISMLIFLFGIWAVYQYIKFISEESEEHADQSSKREFLNLFIYLIIILLFIFFILAIGSLAYRKEAKSYVSALGQNQVEWTKTFGTIKYTDVERNLNAIIISVGIFAVLMILLIGMILACAYFILHSYRFTQTLVQFFCLIFFIIGAVLLYVAIYADRYKDIASANNSMPAWVPIALLVSGVLTIVIAVGGYWAIQMESKNYTGIFSIATGVLTLLILAFSVYAFIYSGDVQKVFDGKCKQILDLMPEDFLVKYAGCSRKYVSTSNFMPTDCPKERILLAWDVKQKKYEQMQEDLKKNPGQQMQPIGEIYGCYDNLCCTAAYNTVASKSNYLALIAIFLFITGLICALGSYKVYDDLDDGDQKSGEQLSIFNNSSKVIMALCVAVVIVIIVALSTLPEKPAQDPNILPPQPSNVTVIDAKMIIKADLNKTVQNGTKELTEDIKKETPKVEEKKEGCGSNCPKLVYKFQLSSKDGSFFKNETANFKNVTVLQDGKEGDKYVVRFNAGPEEYKTFTQFFEFVHDCPMLPASIDVKVSGEVFAAGAVPTAFIENQKNKIKKTLNSNGQPITTTNTPTTTTTAPTTTTTAPTTTTTAPTTSTTAPTTTTTAPTTTTTAPTTTTNPNIVNNVEQTNTKDSVSATVNTRILDYSKLKVGEKFDVMDKNLDFSFVNPKETQVIKAKVLRRVDLKTTIPIQDAEVTIRNLDFGQCSPYKLNTDINGNFVSPKLFVFQDGLTSRFQVVVTATDLTQYKKTVVSGGIGAPAEIDLGVIELWSPSMLENASISAIVSDSINNQPLEGVKVSVYEGFITLDNEQATDKQGDKSAKVSFIQLAEQSEQSEISLIQTNEGQLENYKVFLHNSTNVDGYYEVNNISPNLYTLVFEKEGYYREVLNIEVMGKMTKRIRNISLTPFVDQGKIRIVLSWPDAPADLDIYSIFKTGKFTKCMVFFGKTVCSKTRIDVDNKMGGRKGAETITIDVLEKYIYTFAVRKYVSTAKDNLAPGEQRVEGAPLSSDYNYEFLPDSERPDKIANVTLSESNAKVSIFVNGFKNAISEINVPVNPEGNLLLEADKNKKYYDWWVPFCLNGSLGVQSLRVVNRLTTDIPKEAYCEDIYKNGGNVPGAPANSGTPSNPAAPTVKTFFVEVKNNKMRKTYNPNENTI